MQAYVHNKISFFQLFYEDLIIKIDSILFPFQILKITPLKINIHMNFFN